MASFRTGTVTAIVSERRGLQRVEVDGEPAYVLTQLLAPVALGDRVAINTTAVELGLGTGGWHVVHWNLSHDTVRTDSGGHVMKLRYTSLQTDTGVATEHGDVPDTLDAVPVVTIALHSQLACVAAAVKALDESKRVVYVMTDGAALPVALSDLVADLVYQGVVDATVTAGHAFGGDLEAVNVRSALALARHQLHADVIVAGMGPGSVGTSTPTGYSGLEVGAILDTAHDLGGQPVAVLRVSDADARERHRFVSEHSVVALTRATHVPVVVAVPSGTVHLPDLGPHVFLAEVDAPDAVALLGRRGIIPTTMGRTPADDPRAFTFAAAAGAYAAAVAGR
ncbi:MAG TPA: DUF3866 family protein [Acidimicrobiales bacterium]|nr:DUF3866 family protein [Acidimicrobiales bacterium]